MSAPEKRSWGAALLLVVNYLVLLWFALKVSAATASPLVISISERCLPIGISGKDGGIDIYAKQRKVLRVPEVCKNNPPARLWRDGNDRAVTCGTEPNPLTSTAPIQAVQYVRIGKC